MSVSDKRAPLEGIRVIDLTWVAAGPAALMQLALLGADVIRIESPTNPDYVRFVENPSRDPDMAPVYQALNLAKRAVTLDLKLPEGRALGRRLALTGDVIVESMRPGVAKKLGLDFEELRAERPDLVMASLSGFGQVGREARYRSYAPVFGASGGLSHVTGYPDGIPTQIRASADMRGGIALLAPILAALRRAKREGVGAYIDVAASEASSCLLGHLILDYQLNGRDAGRVGNYDREMAPHGVYECAETESFLTIACRDDGDWRGICRVLPELDLPEFASASARQENRSDLDVRLRQLVRLSTRTELKQALQAEGVPAVESMTNKEIFEDPHAHERGIWVRVEHPRQGERWAIGLPWLSSRDGRGIEPRRAPLVHEHTREILKDELGVSDAEWAEFLANGVVHEPDPHLHAATS